MYVFLPGRSFIFFIALVWSVLPLRAQLSENLVPDLTVTSIFPARVSDWSASAQHANLTLTNRTQDVITAKIDVQLMTADTISARGRLFNMPVLQIIPGINRFDATQLFASLEFEMNQRNTTGLESNTVLSGGMYTLCLRVISEDGSKPLSLPICRQIMIRGQIQPALRLPARMVNIRGGFDETLEFKWELPYNVQAPPGEWLLRIVEANTAENDSLALLIGTVVLERIVRDSMSYMVTNPGTLFTPNGRYLWSVRALENDGTIDNRGQQVTPTTEQSIPTEQWAIPLSFTVSGTSQKRE